jgi:hypothetical protein
MKELAPNRHHILFNQSAWDSTAHTKWLRQSSGLIVRLSYDAHEELHKDITIVPLLDHYTARFVREAMTRSRASKPLDIADDFMLALDTHRRNPRTNYRDRALGELVIEAVESQRPYIEDGLVKAQVYDFARHGRKSKSWVRC